jgi:hypothetical protein
MGIFGRMQSYEEEARLEKIRMWSAAREDCLWIDKLEAGRSGRVAGVVSRLRLDPVSRVIEATTSDGSGTVKAQWDQVSPRSDACGAGMGTDPRGDGRDRSGGRVVYVGTRVPSYPRARARMMGKGQVLSELILAARWRRGSYITRCSRR